MDLISRRFVVLHHEGVPGPHFDLMIETAPDGPLETWRSDIWPITAPTPLVHLPLHRRAYLDYEGPVSKNRGFVRRVDSGTCALTIKANGRWIVAAQSAQREWTLILTPQREPKWTGDVKHENVKT